MMMMKLIPRRRGKESIVIKGAKKTKRRDIFLIKVTTITALCWRGKRNRGTREMTTMISITTILGKGQGQ